MLYSKYQDIDKFHDIIKESNIAIDKENENKYLKKFGSLHIDECNLEIFELGKLLKYYQNCIDNKINPNSNLTEQKQ